MSDAGPAKKKLKPNAYKYQVQCPKASCKAKNAALYEDYVQGDMVCTGCGLVVGDRVIDVGSEWRTFANDGAGKQGDPSRVGAAENPLLQSDLTIKISSIKGQSEMFEIFPVYVDFFMR
eukprot:m.12383 g.12383  ORF g.12383 m.12383 type:complete len:119 (-) comp4642_c0_seq2:846-1202(-)